MSRRPRIASRTSAHGAAAALALLAGVLSPPARAEPPALAADLAALRAQVAGLRRVKPAQVTDPGRLAQYEVRFSQFEEELRRLTGRIEELEHRQRTLEDRFDQLVGDLDQRLLSVEEGSSGAPLAAVAPTPAPDPVTPPAANLGAPPQDLGQFRAAR